jgi:hypothetical protein
MNTCTNGQWSIGYEMRPENSVFEGFCYARFKCAPQIRRAWHVASIGRRMTGDAIENAVVGSIPDR